MIICPNCEAENRPGELFCTNCSFSLSDAVMTSNATIPTRRVQSSPDEASAKGTWGSASFRNGSEILIHIRGVSDPVTIQPSKRVIFGRTDQSSDTKQPDVDFSAFGALEKGVSRHHAALDVGTDTLMLTDIGSSNGTYLNGQRLTPNQPRVLRDGDEVRLGKLVTHIYFK